MVSNMPDTAMVVPVNLISDDQLSGISSFEDALAIVGDVFGGEVLAADKELGNGFAVLENKSALIGVGLLVLKAEQFPGDHGPFTTLHVVTSDGRKLIVNDGGSGIHAQITTLWEKRPDKKGVPLLVKKGLRVSEYTHPEFGASKTYYLDTAASE